MHVSQLRITLLSQGPQGDRAVQADSLFCVSVRMVQGTLRPQLLASHLQAIGAAALARRLSTNRC